MSRKITWKDTRTLLLSSMGSALEYYDFTVFVFFAGIISDVFFPPGIPEWIRLIQTYAIFALGYFVRPIGGVVIAHFGDRLGRKKMFIFSICLMAFPTLLIGVLPTYAEIGWFAPGLLLLMRILQGFAIAGELPGALVFISEHADRRRTGVSCSAVMGILYLGLALGSGTSGIVTSLIPNKHELLSYGWRIPFIAGGIFGLVGVYLRRYLEETPLFSKIRETKQLSRKLPLAEVVRSYVPACLFIAGLSFCLNQVNTILFQYMPTMLLQQYSLPQHRIFWANTAAILVYAAMNPVWGWIGDRVGRNRALILGAVLTVVAVVWLFSQIPEVRSGRVSLMLPWCVVGLTAGFVGLFASLATSVFPTEVRLTGFAFPYNIAAAIGAGLTPVLLTWLIKLYGETASLYLILGACSGFCILGLVYPRLHNYLGAQESPLTTEVKTSKQWSA